MSKTFNEASAEYAARCRALGAALAKALRPTLIAMNRLAEKLSAIRLPSPRGRGRGAGGEGS